MAQHIFLSFLAVALVSVSDNDSAKQRSFHRTTHRCHHQHQQHHRHRRRHHHYHHHHHHHYHHHPHHHTIIAATANSNDGEGAPPDNGEAVLEDTTGRGPQREARRSRSRRRRETWSRSMKSVGGVGARGRRFYPIPCDRCRDQTADLVSRG